MASTIVRTRQNRENPYHEGDLSFILVAAEVTWPPRAPQRQARARRPPLLGAAGSRLRLEPLGAQQRHEQVEEQKHGDDERDPDHVMIL